MTLKRREFLAAGLALCGATYFTGARADAFPRRSITLIVPFVPGGNVDSTARSVAPALGRILKQSIIVYNRAGAGGAIGAGFVAQSDPNGYTLLITVPDTLTIVPQMVKTPYQFDSFQSIGSVATTTPLLVVRDGSPFKNMAQFLSAARTKPGSISVAHDGPGSTSQLALMQFANAAGIKLNMIPYQGSGPALIDVLGGQVDAAVDQMTSSLAHLRAHQLRALAVMSSARDPLVPDVPTLHEAGVQFDLTTTLGIFAPAAVPPGVVATLNAALVGALADDQVKSRLLAIGSVARSSSAAAFQQILVQANERAKVMAKAGMLVSHS
jgi:tripartite-type tricarboxylate transporter receptor subunit TctC